MLAKLWRKAETVPDDDWQITVVQVYEARWYRNGRLMNSVTCDTPEEAHNIAKMMVKNAPHTGGLCD